MKRVAKNKGQNKMWVGALPPALFIDLPANVVGSFVMGLFCGLEKQLARHKTWLLLGANVVQSIGCGKASVAAWIMLRFFFSFFSSYFFW